MSRVLWPMLVTGFIWFMLLTVQALYVIWLSQSGLSEVFPWHDLLELRHAYAICLLAETGVNLFTGVIRDGIYVLQAAYKGMNIEAIDWLEDISRRLILRGAGTAFLLIVATFVLWVLTWSPS